MKKQKKKNSRKEKKVEQCSQLSFKSASVKICKNQLTNQIEEKAEYSSTREQKNSQWKSAFSRVKEERAWLAELNIEAEFSEIRQDNEKKSKLVDIRMEMAKADAKLRVFEKK